VHLDVHADARVAGERDQQVRAAMAPAAVVSRLSELRPTMKVALQHEPLRIDPQPACQPCARRRLPATTGMREQAEADRADREVVELNGHTADRAEDAA
jgi:hypothetical protein